mmetsp:Transcript_26221/g.55797  ORF Transcript_26221/g.55797 Transcript_26221/m.55797 type:complete len:119 (+) Transcript_26221:3-359(+)
MAEEMLGTSLLKPCPDSEIIRLRSAFCLLDTEGVERISLQQLRRADLFRAADAAFFLRHIDVEDAEGVSWRAFVEAVCFSRGWRPPKQVYVDWVLAGGGEWKRGEKGIPIVRREKTVM